MVEVTKLPKDPGPAGWNRILPEPEKAVPLEGSQRTEWLVIGAGFAGLAAARRITEHCPEDRVVVLEATRVGEGPAGRNSGFMIDLPHDLSSENYGGEVNSDKDEIADNRQGIDFADAMAEAFGVPEEAFSRSGKINAAAGQRGDRHNREFARHLSTIGEPHRLLDEAEMRELTGTTYYRSGLFTPGAAMIQPAMFVRGVARGLRSNRVAIHEESPVASLSRDGAKWVAKTPRGEVTAGKVVLAVNGHLQSFGHLVGRLIHVFTYASMTRELTGDEVVRLGGAPTWGVTPADPMGTTVRRISGTGGDRIVVRNRFTIDPSMEIEPERIASVSEAHDRSFAERFPMLSGVGMEHRWGGRLCLSRNHVQVIGELEPGLFSACCQNGLGTAKGTLAGMLAADLACGVGSPALDRALAAPKPERLPAAPLTQLAGNLRIRWGEFRAGADF